MYRAEQLLHVFNERLKEETCFRKQPHNLYDPIDYVLSLGGKRLRPVLMLMAYNLYKNDIALALAPALGIEVYHNFTLLHDDLMDKADRRRGKATVHKQWSDNTAILSGDAMTVLAYEYMTQVNAACLGRVLGLFNQTAMEICEGQQMDMDFEQRNDVIVSEYMEMIRLKTSVLLACALKIGAILGDASEEDAGHLYDFGIHLGLAFQLKDDLLDVYGNPETFGKNIGGDIVANKKTYLLIQAWANATEEQRDRLTACLHAGDMTAEDKIAEVTYIYNKVGVRELCEREIEEYSKQAMCDLQQVSVSAEKKVGLAQLCEELISREV